MADRFRNCLRHFSHCGDKMPEGSNSRKGGVILIVQSFMVDGPRFVVAGAQCEQGVACSAPIVRSQRER